MLRGFGGRLVQEERRMVSAIFGENSRVIGLVAQNSCDYFEEFFDLVSSGAIVVPLRSASDEERMTFCQVTEVLTPEKRVGWIDRIGELPNDNSVAQVAFTSGTQGEPKGIILTRANMWNTCRRLKEFMCLDRSIREYVGVPVYHSFGLGRCLAVAAAGGRAYIPAHGFDAVEIASMLRSEQINAISAVPSLWRTLLQQREVIGSLGARVRWIEIGSQSMTADEKRAMRGLFPNAKIVQHYGLTEASRSTFLDVSEAPDSLLSSVGSPYGDVEIRVGDDSRILIRGSNVAAERLEQGHRVRNVDRDGWFATSDMGAVQNGILYFKGRLDDVINLGGLKISAEVLQQKVSEALGLGDSIAIVRVSDSRRGEGVLAAVTNDCALDDARISEAIQAELANHGIKAASSVHVMRVDAFPLTPSGKLQRNVLATRFEEEQRRPTRRPDHARPAWWRHMQMPIFKRPASVLEIYQTMFPGRSIQSTDSFVGLGGDSLTYVEASIALESRLGRIPKDWQERSVASLEAIRPLTSWLKPVDTTIFLRFVCIIVIVAFHFSPFVYGGATFLLFVVAGYNFSRFQFPKVMENDSVRSILQSALRIAIPTVLVLLLVQTAITGYALDVLLLVSNFFLQENWHALTWYVEVLIQILIVLSVVFAFPSVRKFARSGQSRFALGFFSVSLLTAVVAPAIWDTAPLNDHVPHMLLWVFLLGWLLERSNTTRQRLAAGCISFISPLAVWGFSAQPDYVYYGTFWIWIGALILILFDRIPMPVPLNVLAYWIGGGSLFIYITHWYIPPVLRRGFAVDNYVVDITVSIAVGVIAWICWEFLTRLLLQIAQRRRQAILAE
jgi:acyl-CoA synthetase (AMP-forming)/AMP-acid ligase II